MRVRRSSDNAEIDIGFTPSGGLNTTLLLSHCGASSGFVTIWYDQSGNGRNMVQATPGSQPRIVNAGTVDTSGGIPAIVCDATNDTMVAATWGTVAQPFTRNGVFALPSSLGSFRHITNTDTGSPNTRDFIFPGPAIMVNAGTDGPSSSVSLNERLVYTSIFNSTSSDLFKNGTSGGVGDAGTNSTRGISINRNETGTNFGGFIFQELVLIDSLISTIDRQFIERNQGAYYGITVA
jgi:hypothetical protein